MEFKEHLIATDITIQNSPKAPNFLSLMVERWTCKLIDEDQAWVRFSVEPNIFFFLLSFRVKVRDSCLFFYIKIEKQI